MIRTYAGHSTAVESNRLFHANLAKGQTALSVAFDLPTQTGYDPDHVLSRGEVGKVGVPVSHIGDMRDLLAAIPLASMNTSMTINATAAWLLALYVAVADEQGVQRAKLSGTTQNDIIKEYLSRGTHVFPPKPSMKLITDTISFSAHHMPKWNPMNVCSYHLQEAGATPIQELSFALATAVAVLDAAKEAVEPAIFPEIVGRISFFVNAGIRFITEMCKMRAFTELWDDICCERYGITDAKFRRFRYGVQVNSLGLTEQQPENNVYRILLEMLAVVLSRNARARAVQLPAWNEALGLPRAWDQQWSLRLQQIVAYETDLLEYADIFEGSTEIAAKVASLKQEARTELEIILGMGGAIAAVEDGYMKRALVHSNTQRLKAIERGEIKIIGVNMFTAGATSPLSTGEGEMVLTVSESVEFEQIEKLKAWRAKRDTDAVKDALAGLKAAAGAGSNIMEPSITCARAGVTTGEWAEVLRGVFGEYRAPTGVLLIMDEDAESTLEDVRTRVRHLTQALGKTPRFLMAKPGLDGHSNGAEQIAIRAADCGLEVIYEGIRLTPEQIVNTAIDKKVNLIGLSILSGSHVRLIRDVMNRLRVAGLASIPVVAGGIIPPEDINILKQLGVARIYTPKDFDLNTIIGNLVDLMERSPANGGMVREG